MQSRSLSFVSAHQARNLVGESALVRVYRRKRPDWLLAAPGTACESQQFEGRKFMSTSLNGKTIAFLVAPEGVEQVELVRSFFDAGKPVAVICHAPGR